LLDLHSIGYKVRHTKVDNDKKELEGSNCTKAEKEHTQKINKAQQKGKKTDTEN